MKWRHIISCHLKWNDQNLVLIWIFLNSQCWFEKCEPFLVNPGNTMNVWHSTGLKFHSVAVVGKVDLSLSMTQENILDETFYSSIKNSCYQKSVVSEQFMSIIWHIINEFPEFFAFNKNSFIRTIPLLWDFNVETFSYK